MPAGKLRKPCQVLLRRLYSSSSASSLQIAVVGSGPSGFYVAGPLLREHPQCFVDFYEKLPVPFGLVRFGVAPDHQEVKNCIHQFEDLVAKNVHRVSFYGNVTVGKDVSVQELRDRYHALVFAYGAESEKPMGIPGETLRNSISARSLVGWYNGLQEKSGLNPLFNTDTAVVVGHGNVGLDVARILLSPLDRLRETDIPDSVLHALSQSGIRRVITVGRRGPLEVAFTIKELREMVNMPGCFPLIHWEGTTGSGVKELMGSLPRPRKRITELMWKTHKTPLENLHKTWELKFCRSPLALISCEGTSDPRVEAVKLAKNRMEESKPIPTGETETVKCGLVVHSVGYRSLPIHGLPFDQNRHVTETEPDGFKVKGMSGVYACGWCARGPTGVLASTQLEAKACSKTILDDISQGKFPSAKKGGAGSIEEVLKSRSVRWISWRDWKKIDKREQELGAKKNKPREKLIDIEEMFNCASH